MSILAVICGFVIGIANDTIRVTRPEDLGISTPATILIIYGLFLIIVTTAGCFSSITARIIISIIVCYRITPKILQRLSHYWQLCIYHLFLVLGANRFVHMLRYLWRISFPIFRGPTHQVLQQRQFLTCELWRWEQFSRCWNF